MNPYKFGVFIGRFQPCHGGHIHALGIAASQCDKLLILIGSANKARSIRNPWTYRERVQMLRKKLAAAGVNNCLFAPLNDTQHNHQWVSEVKHTASEQCQVAVGVKFILFGHQKDGNDYLKWFPEWQYRDIPAEHNVNATQIRQRMFQQNSSEVPETVLEDYHYFEAEKEMFKNYPFPDCLNINCADAVVVCNSKVLLIKRANAPGRNTWALPGGHKESGETFLDCAIRELVEETNLRVPEKVLRGSVTKTELFDTPGRGCGPLVRSTLGVLIHVDPDHDGKEPRVSPRDDAKEAKWFDLHVVQNNLQLYDDHSNIIASLTKYRPLPAIYNSWLL